MKAAPRLVVAVAEQDTVYSDAYFGVSFSESKPDAAHLVAGILGSAVATWYVLMSGSAFGLWLRGGQAGRHRHPANPRSRHFLGLRRRETQRGKQRREVHLPRRIGVDETSFQKRHEYVTVINDLDGHVVHVADGRSKETLEQFFQQFDRQRLADVETVAMDMWEPYIRVTGEYVCWIPH